MHTYRATVTNVVDGDTIDVTIDLGFKIFTKQRIRLNGIDTPERGKPGFDEAKQWVTNRLLGKDITLVTTKVSKWGYFLGDVYIDQQHINHQLVEQTLANPYDGGTKEI